MQTQITARHFDASPALRQYASDRLSRLERFYDGITNAHIVLEAATPLEKGAEITLSVYRQRLTAQNTALTHEEAIDRCVARLRTQIMRYKAKLRSKHRKEHR